LVDDFRSFVGDNDDVDDGFDNERCFNIDFRPGDDDVDN